MKRCLNYKSAYNQDRARAGFSIKYNERVAFSLIQEHNARTDSHILYGLKVWQPLNQYNLYNTSSPATKTRLQLMLILFILMRF